MKLETRCALAVLLGWALGCGPEPDALEPATVSPVVARTQSGLITVADVETFVGRLGPSYRPDPTLSAAERYQRLARRLVLEELLLAEARASGVEDDPQVAALDHPHRRLVYSQHYLTTLEAPPAITVEQLRERFAESKERFEHGEKRRVSHIFLRHGEDGDRQASRQRLEAIRQQILDGRPFELMAREHSQSETRHQDGMIGLVERGFFPPDFDRVVFDLAPATPSDVYTTRDGTHLFYVHNVLEARAVTFEDVRALLRRELELERELQQLRSAATELPWPKGTSIADSQQVASLVASAPADRILLSMGDATLTVGQLREQLRTVARQLGDLVNEELAVWVFEELKHREIIHQHMLAEERAGTSWDLPAEQLEEARRRQIVDHHTRRQLVERLTGDEERLEAYHATNALRFSSPLRLELRRLAVPERDDGPAVMARLERSRAALDRGELTLEALAGELGGSVRPVGPISIGQLRATDRPAVRFAPLLKPGEHSPPYKAADGLVIFSVVDRIEPQPLPLDLVRDRVIEDYLSQRGSELFEELAAEKLAAVGFEIDALPEQLAR